MGVEKLRPIAPWVALVGTSVLYALTAFAGLGLSAQAVGVTIFWPAAGVAAALASASSSRLRPYVIAGVGLGTVLSAAPFVDVNWLHVWGAATANVAEAVVAGAILRPRLPQTHRIVRLADVGALLLASLVGPAVGSVIGGAATAITFGSQPLPAILSWFAADGLGIVLIGPGALAVVSAVRDRAPRGIWLKTALVGLITVLVLVIAIETKEITGRSFAYFILLPLILATIFVGQRGTAMLMAGTAFLVVWSTEESIGPFADVDSPLSPLTAAQVFLFVIQVTLLLVATEASRRRDLLAEIEGVFDAALDAVLVVDESDTIRRANLSSEAMLGEHVVGRKFTDFLVHPLDAEVMVAQRAVITRGRRADGSEFWAEVSEGKVIEQSRRVRRAVVIRDASQRIEAQEKLEQMRDQFVSNMTHELRTPLTAIIGYTDWLLEGAEGETKSDLETIRNSAAELSNLVDGILDFKRTTEAESSITKVDLSSLVEKVTVQLTPAAATRNVHIAIHYDPGVLVKGDHEQLERVVANLVSNAIKYSRPEGEVTISLRAFDGTAQLVISDRGIGISAADQARIFERFFRASSAVSAGIPGTGLGLAIARDVARGHKGDLILESSLGVGTTLTLRLPLLTESTYGSSIAATSSDSVGR